MLYLSFHVCAIFLMFNEIIVRDKTKGLPLIEGCGLPPYVYHVFALMGR
jgi:hypothetical protein